MENNQIWNNISRKIANESSQEDEVLVDNWLKSNKRNLSVYKTLVDIWNYRPSQLDNSSRIYEKYRARLDNYNNFSSKRRVGYHWYRIAVVLVLIVGFSFFFHYYVNFQQDIPLVYQEISVPKGSRTSIVLPDNSKVWISNNSTIKYPSQFTGESRELFLKGEAYFEVSHNKEKPFIVNLGETRIKVQGTKFSVSAYPEDNQIITDLIDGKVLFEIKAKNTDSYKSIELNPGFGIVYDKQEQRVSEHLVEPDFYKYWDSGIYSFKNESFESLSKKIFQIYNIKIVFIDEYLKSKTYSGSFSVDDNIFTFMESIKSTSVVPIEYTYHDSEIFVELK